MHDRVNLRRTSG